MTRKEMDSVIEFTKAYIEDNYNCRIGWAATEVLKRNTHHHERRKLVSGIIKSNRYKADDSKTHPDDWDVYFNPDYRLNKTIKTATVVMALASILSFAVSVAALIITIYPKSESPKHTVAPQRQLQQQIDTSLQLHEKNK